MIIGYRQNNVFSSSAEILASQLSIMLLYFIKFISTNKHHAALSEHYPPIRFAFCLQFARYKYYSGADPGFRDMGADCPLPLFPCLSLPHPFPPLPYKRVWGGEGKPSPPPTLLSSIRYPVPSPYTMGTTNEQTLEKILKL